MIYRRLRRLFGKLMLIVGGGASALLLAEFAIRLTTADVPPVPPEQQLVWAHWQGRNSEAREQASQYYNSFGVYDRHLGLMSRALLQEEEQFPARPGYRVILLGDSITGDSPYSEKLMNGLRWVYPKMKFNFLVAGVPGWDTWQEAEYLRTRVEQLKPQLVILQFCINDFAVTPVFWRGPDGNFYAYNAGKWSQYINKDLMTHSRLARKVVYRLLQRFPQEPTPEDDKVSEGFKAAVELSQRYKFTLRIVLLPAFGEKRDFDKGQRETVRAIIAENKLEALTIDLLDLPTQYPTHEWQREPGDAIHPNHKGAIILAQKIIAELPSLETQAGSR